MLGLFMSRGNASLISHQFFILYTQSHQVCHLPRGWSPRTRWELLPHRQSSKSHLHNPWPHVPHGVLAASNCFLESLEHMSLPGFLCGFGLSTCPQRQPGILPMRASILLSLPRPRAGCPQISHNGMLITLV